METCIQFMQGHSSRVCFNNITMAAESLRELFLFVTSVFYFYMCTHKCCSIALMIRNNQ